MGFGDYIMHWKWNNFETKPKTNQQHTHNKKEKYKLKRNIMNDLKFQIEN